MNNKPLSNGPQDVRCDVLSDLIRVGMYENIYLVLNVQNPSFAPMVFLLTRHGETFQSDIEHIANVISYATEGDRYMKVQVQGRALYLECGQFPPHPMLEAPYVRVCPNCDRPKMRMETYRQGQGNDEQSWYTCQNCLTEVYINVITFDDEGEYDD